MKKIVDIAFLYLKITYSSRAVLIFQLLLPLLFTFLIGQGTSGFGGGGEVQWSIVLINEDEGKLGDLFVEIVGESPILQLEEVDKEEAISLISDPESDSEIVAIFVLPALFSERIGTDEAQQLDFYINPEKKIQAQSVEQALLAALTRLEGIVGAAQMATAVGERVGLVEDEESRIRYYEQSLAQARLEWREPAVVTEGHLENEFAAQEIAVGVNQSAPGSMVLFTMFTILGGAVSLIQERRVGTLRRLLLMPISKGVILGGKMLGIYLVGMVQVGILIIAGQLLFGVQWGQSPWALFLLVTAFTATITCLTIMMAAVLRTEAQANALTTIVVLVMSGLGGAMWPIEIVPEWMQQVGHLTPVAWAMDGFQDILLRGAGVADILLSLIALIGFGGLFLIVGLYQFKYE